jgi:hypothetical protein
MTARPAQKPMLTSSSSGEFLSLFAGYDQTGYSAKKAVEWLNSLETIGLRECAIYTSLVIMSHPLDLLFTGKRKGVKINDGKALDPRLATYLPAISAFEPKGATGKRELWGEFKNINVTMVRMVATHACSLYSEGSYKPKMSQLEPLLKRFGNPSNWVMMSKPDKDNKQSVLSDIAVKYFATK